MASTESRVDELEGDVYEIAEALRRVCLALDAVMEVESNPEFPLEHREHLLGQIAPRLPEVHEHLQSVLTRLGHVADR